MIRELAAFVEHLDLLDVEQLHVDAAEGDDYTCASGPVGGISESVRCSAHGW